MFTFTIDGAKITQEKSKFDTGLDFVATFIFDRKFLNTNAEIFIRYENFSKLHFNKMGIGVNYRFEFTERLLKPLYEDIKFEVTIGAELSVIYRKNLHNESTRGYGSYAFNLELRYYLFKNMPLILSNNLQRRTDFNREAPQTVNLGEFVFTPHIGIGIKF